MKIGLNNRSNFLKIPNAFVLCLVIFQKMSKNTCLYFVLIISLTSLNVLCTSDHRYIRYSEVSLKPFKAMDKVVPLESKGEVLGYVTFDSNSVFIQFNEPIEVFKEDQFTYKESPLGNAFVDFVRSVKEMRKNRMILGVDTVNIFNQAFASYLDSNTSKRVIGQLNKIKDALDTIITEAKLDTVLNPLIKTDK